LSPIEIHLRRAFHPPLAWFSIFLLNAFVRRVKRRTVMRTMAVAQLLDVTNAIPDLQ